MIVSARRGAWRYLALIPCLYLLHLILKQIYTPKAPPSPFVGHEDLFFETAPRANQAAGESDAATADSPAAAPAPAPAPGPASGLQHQDENPAYAHFKPPEKEGRESDLIDTFATYKGAGECGIKSTTLHLPFSPACKTKDEVLRAMSCGGRAGYDEPFIPQGCSMRWYSSFQVCQILNRFSHIFIIGDSLQRHVTNALYAILREDIALGGITEWDPPNDGERYKSKDDCKCQNQIITKECSEKQIDDSTWVSGNKSSSVICPHLSKLDASITYHKWLQWPLPQEDLDSLTDALPKDQPNKPYAFIIHHEMWNNVNVTETGSLLDQICDHLKNKMPFLNDYKYFNRLYLTANAGGLAKGLGFLATQGNHMLAKFEREIQVHVAGMSMDFLGMFNMSVQSTQWDGVHTTLEQNLLKVQMITNWLDKIDVDSQKKQ